MTGLSFRGVSHSYDGTPALRGFDLEVGEGEIVCLVGPSGCGKTTALRLAAGLERLQRGEVAVAGRTVAGAGRHLPPEARGVGFVFQEFALFPHMTVADNIAFGLRRESPRRRRDIVAGMLRTVGLERSGGKYPHMLSGGEQQRVALARALAPRPAILLLDEPFSGLDVRLREAVRDHALDVLRELSASVLLVTHDAEEAMYAGDRIAVLQQGALVQTGEPACVYGRPASPFVARFLGDLNWVHGVVRGTSVDSPIGPVDAAGCGEGERVDVLIRPEGLRLCTRDGAAGRPALVLDSRLLGYGNLVRLRLDDGSELRARVAERTVPPPGSRVAIRAESDAVFVFSCDPRGSRPPSPG